MTDDVKQTDEAKAEADWKAKEADYVVREIDGKLTVEERLATLEDKVELLWAGHPAYNGPERRKLKRDELVAKERKKVADKLADEANAKAAEEKKRKAAEKPVSA